MDNGEIVKRVQFLQSQRDTVEQQWELIERYVTPYRGEFLRDQVENENAVDWERRDVYDSTPVHAHQTLAASLHGALTSPSVRWFQLRFRDEQLRENKIAMEWLDNCADEVFWSLADSNFDLEMNETYQDLAGFGTSPLMLEEGDKAVATDWGGLLFSSVPLRETFFDEGLNGEPYRFFRKFEWRASQIMAKFPKADLPKEVTDADARGDSTRFEVIFAVYPRQGRSAKGNTRLPPSKRPFESKYVLKMGAVTLDRGGYYEMPVYIPRWRKTNTSCWGNSPAMLALGDILTLNQARYLQLRAAEKLIDPPVFSQTRAVIGELDLNSGARNTLRDINGVKVFDTRGDIQVSDYMIEQLQQSVRDYFYVDQLRMPAPQAQPMTATEVQLRHEQMQRLLGPTLGRLKTDLLDPIIARTFKMLARAGRLPEAPDIVVDIDPDFDVEYLGSLARSQKVDEAATIERVVAAAAAMAAQGMPDAVEAIDPIGAVMAIAEALNAPHGALRDKQTAQKRVEANAERQAQAAQAMQAQAAGDAAQSVAQAEEMINGQGAGAGTVPAVPTEQGGPGVT